MSDLNGYTPTQKRLLAVLDDGMPHAPKVLLDCIDELADENSLKFHLCVLRKKLALIGRDVVFREGAYRMMRTLASANDGKR